jgi:DNA mismatch repair ATPase MutS
LNLINEFLNIIFVADQDLGDEDEEVVFLYKLEPGPTESSFGLNVAKMAGLPNDILQMATKLAKQFEQTMTT